MTISEAAQLVIQAGALAEGGEIFVLDMGKPVKILDLAKKMITLSGKQPVLDPQRPTNAGEIAICITGLRPGEKMFEELSYNNNLAGTIHPRILSTDDSNLSDCDLSVLLDEAANAIAFDDYQKLIDVVRAVCEGVANENSSNDVFFDSPVDYSDDIVVPLSTHKPTNIKR